jgi:hypothetical protein
MPALFAQSSTSVVITGIDKQEVLDQAFNAVKTFRPMDEEQEVEQTKSEPNEKPLKKAPQQAPEQLQRIKIDTYIGMAFSNLIASRLLLWRWRLPACSLLLE